MKKNFFVTDAKNLEREVVLSGETTDQLMAKKAIENAVEVEKRVEVKCQPLGDRVLVRRVKEEQKGLIIVPNAKRENSEKGEIVAVGPGRFGEAMTSQVGDVVMFTKHAVMELEIDGEVFVLMRESDILATI
jgi:chaperonin GroES